MNKKRLFILMTMSVAVVTSTLSCHNTRMFKKELIWQFKKQNLTSNSFLAKKDLNITTSSDFLLFQTPEIENNLNENIIIDEQIDEENEETTSIIDEQEEVLNQELEITKQQLLDLEKRYKKDFAKNSRLKSILIGASISSAIITGLSIGIGSYFGITKSDTYAQKRKKELEDILNIQKSLIKESNPDDSLQKIFLKLMDIGFEKELPTGIFDLFDELLFKKALNGYINEKEKERFKNILKTQIKDRSKEIVNELLDLLKSRNIVAETSSDNVINSVKNIVSLIIKKYLPDFIKAAILFVSEINSKINTGSTTQPETSLLGRAIEATLKLAGYNSGDSKNMSKIISIFSSALANSNNDLIKIIITKMSNAIDSVNLSFDFFKDLLEIIKKTISNILTKPNSQELDINSIFNKLIPAFLDVFENVANKSENSEDFIVFINNLFLEENNNKALYTILLKDNDIENADSKFNFKTIINTFISSNAQNKNQEEYNFADLIPNIEVSFFTIVNGIFKFSDFKKFINKFLFTFIKPLIKIAKEQEEKLKKIKDKNTNNSISFNINGIDTKSPYNAIFRIYSLYSYLYYKHVPKQEGILGNLISLINPFKPEKFIPNLIKSEWPNINDEQLKKIFGDNISKEPWYSFNSDHYSIFQKIKEYANGNKNDEFKELIKNASPNITTNNISKILVKK
ncbi:hypothetical protein [Mycoplasma phocimorsus]|uniref:hypothetical protein n=1 Tax=Mycoplasma phocimorsus TaxID=3045839 RepID=UPI0024BF3250|nr:hypothetical protein [Mycoplasma phocimorsus]MDJ1646582.1 hypothetical protein [Mycoplasma phocimorsus]